MFLILLGSQEYTDASNYLEEHQENSSNFISPSDPLDFTGIELVVSNVTTQHGYIRKWRDFVNFSGISESVAPSESMGTFII